MANLGGQEMLGTVKHVHMLGHTCSSASAMAVVSPTEGVVVWTVSEHTEGSRYWTPTQK